MSRSRSYLRRGLLGIVFVGSLGFGATQALAKPQVEAGPKYCFPGPCNRSCVNSGFASGACADGVCTCQL